MRSSIRLSESEFSLKGREGTVVFWGQGEEAAGMKSPRQNGRGADSSSKIGVSRSQNLCARSSPLIRKVSLGEGAEEGVD